MGRGDLWVTGEGVLKFMGFGDFLLGEESILYCTGTEDLSLCILSGDLLIEI